MLLLCAVIVGSASAWAESGVITITSENLTGTSGYPTAAQTFTVGDFGFGYNASVYRPTANNTPSGWGGGQIIQFKKSSGELYNTQAIGRITNIRVYRASGTTNFTVYSGSTASPADNGVASNAKSGVTSGTETIDYTKYENKKTSEGTTTLTYFDFDLSSSKPSYFTVKNTSNGALYLWKIVITYEKEEVSLASACTDGTNYYGTYSNALAFIVPEDLIVSEVKVANGILQVENYSAGDIVPANTGVMLASTTAGAHYLTLTSGGTSNLGANNMLKASGDAGISAAEMTETDTKFYRLTMHNGVTLGFYWGATDGAAFALAANKAYLAVPDAEAAKLSGFTFGEEETTDISQMEKMRNGENEKTLVYNLAGQRVGKDYKGIVVVNGKKYVNK